MAGLVGAQAQSTSVVAANATDWTEPGTGAVRPRRVLVMSNCQTGGLAATLRAIAPDHEVRQLMWTGVEPSRLRALVADADVFVTSMPRDLAHEVIAATSSAAQLIIVPQIFFGGFHPDLTQVPVLDATGRRSGEWEGPARSYHSRLVLWGWADGRPADEIVSWFTPETFGRVGYYTSWATSMRLMGEAMADSDLDLDGWYLPLAGRGAFMLTNNHPRIDAIVQLARQVWLRMGGDPAAAEYPWEQVIPDGLLATAEVWPVYPGIADHLGLAGTFRWRLATGELIGREEFVSRSLDSYRSLDRSTVDLRHVLENPQFAEALGAGVAT